MNDLHYYGTGRRKTATARVFLRPGSGDIEINRRPLDTYFANEVLKMIVKQPLLFTETADSFDIKVTVKGGGASGQAGAIRHGITRALVDYNEELRPKLSDDSVRSQIEAELDRLLKEVNEEVEAFERLQFLAVVKDPWLIENGFLTPTMKMKRSQLEDTYGPKADEWYGAGRRVVWEA